jgi:hypothetical protein
MRQNVLTSRAIPRSCHDVRAANTLALASLDATIIHAMAPPNARYTEDEMKEILRRALTAQKDNADAISHDDLLAAAKEVGIDTAAVEAAAREVSDERALTKSSVAEAPATRTGLDAKQLRARRRFYRHLGTYVLVNAFLMALDFLVSGGSWFFFPLLGWGLGLALHGMNAFMTGPETDDERARREYRDARRLEREARRLEKFERKRARIEAKAQLHASARQFESAVQNGVASLLESLAKQMDRHAGAPRVGPRVERGIEPGVRVDARRGAGDDAEAVARDEAGMHRDEGRRRR